MQNSSFAWKQPAAVFLSIAIITAFSSKYKLAPVKNSCYWSVSIAEAAFVRSKYEYRPKDISRYNCKYRIKIQACTSQKQLRWNWSVSHSCMSEIQTQIQMKYKSKIQAVLSKKQHQLECQVKLLCRYVHALEKLDLGAK